MDMNLTRTESQVSHYIAVTWADLKPTVQLCLHPSRGRYFEISVLETAEGALPEGLPGWVGGIGLQWTARKRNPVRLRPRRLTLRAASSRRAGRSGSGASISRWS